MPTYSIVIPVYNAERYLEQCIGSVLSQCAEAAYEVIMVDDGSVDQSPQICDRYAEQYACMKVLHQKNQGVSAARNAGICMASGEYILFLDADDCWDDSMLKSLNQVRIQHPDIIEFGYCIFGDAVRHEPVLPAFEVADQTGAEYMEAHDAMDSMPIGSCWSAAFRRQFLTEHRISFPVGVSYGEDLEFHLCCLKHAGMVSSIREPLYRYRANEASVTHTPSVKKARDMLSQCAKLYRLFPYRMLANYYCLAIPYIAQLAREDAEQLNAVLRENRDILRHTSGRSAKIAGMFYGVFGWHRGSRLIRFLVDRRYAKKG